jgi:Flp pilus assembly protein TadG
VTVVEFVLLTPVLFLLMFGTVEFGLVLYARHVAVAAAQQGARTAREEAYTRSASWAGDSETAASDWVNQLVGGLVVPGTLQTTATLQGSLTGTPYPEAEMQVSFHVVTVVPWTFNVEADSTGPVECFYTPQGLCDGG